MLTALQPLEVIQYKIIQKY